MHRVCDAGFEDISQECLARLRGVRENFHLRQVISLWQICHKVMLVSKGWTFLSHNHLPGAVTVRCLIVMGEYNVA